MQTQISENSDYKLNRTISNPPEFKRSIPNKIQPSRLETIVEAIIKTDAPKVSHALLDMRDSVVANGYILLRKLPNRTLLLKKQLANKSDCPFCKTPSTEFLEELDYHGLLVSQNLGPYDHCSILLKPPPPEKGPHRTQSDTLNLISELGPILFHELPEGVTILSNQRAGNSQEHLHLQIVGQLLPISKLVQQDHQETGLNWSATGIAGVEYCLKPKVLPKYQPYQYTEHFSGCLLKGEPKEVTVALCHYIQSADKNNITDKFNFTAWKNADSTVTIFVVLRSLDEVKPNKKALPSSVGALAVSGFVVDESNTDLGEFDYGTFVRYLSDKVLAPIEVFPVD